MKTYGTTSLAIFALALSMSVMFALAANTENDDPRCAAFEDEGNSIADDCKEKYPNEEEPIALLRCLWKGMKQIDIVAEDVQECQAMYPEDQTELFCGVETLICSLEKLVDQCPSFVERHEEKKGKKQQQEE